MKTDQPIRGAEGGVLLDVRLVPRARRDEVEGIYGDSLKIRVAAPPVEGRANEALLRFLGRKLGVSRSRFEIRRGRTSRRKLVWIDGVDEEAVRRALGLAQRG